MLTLIIQFLVALLVPAVPIIWSRQVYHGIGRILIGDIKIVIRLQGGTVAVSLHLRRPLPYTNLDTIPGTNTQAGRSTCLHGSQRCIYLIRREFRLKIQRN
jgi:hypothetical protein